MATITEDYVSFEVARLLKEKGFNENIHTVYEPIFNKSFNYPLKPNSYTNVIAAPTLQMAMKWLREIKDWHIVLTPMFADDIKGEMVLYGYDWEISSPSREQTEHSKDFLPNYEQAVEEAIKYCLENLI